MRVVHKNQKLWAKGEPKMEEEDLVYTWGDPLRKKRQTKGPEQHSNPTSCLGREYRPFRATIPTTARELKGYRFRKLGRPSSLEYQQGWGKLSYQEEGGTGGD